jgi:hypothetical protein
MSKIQKPTTPTPKPAPKPNISHREGGSKNGQVPRMENPPKPPPKKTN